MTVRRAILRGALLLSAVALLAQGGDPVGTRRRLEQARQSARDAGRKLEAVESHASEVGAAIESRGTRASRLDLILADTLESATHVCTIRVRGRRMGDYGLPGNTVSRMLACVVEVG